MLLCVSALHCSSQAVDWYELIVIPDLQNASFLVSRVDSVHKKCHVRDELRYCTDAEYAHDYRVPSLRDEQVKAIKKTLIKCILVSKDSLTNGTFSDLKKYPFLIDYDYDLIGLETGHRENFFLKLDFILIERTTGNILGRSMQYDIEEPFNPMSKLLQELSEFHASE